MCLLKSSFWKPLVLVLLLSLGTACASPVMHEGAPGPYRGVTLLIKNEGITPITVRTSSRMKLAWVFPGEETCVVLYSTTGTEELQAQIGRQNFYIPSARFIPETSATGGWVWVVNEVMEAQSTFSIVPLSPPCVK